MKLPRKILQIAAVTEGESPGQLYGTVYALADDGTLWVRWALTEEWKQLSGLPDRDG